MQVSLDADVNEAKRVKLGQMETYMGFRTQLPKPTQEDAHLRHILRFYTARSFAKSGYDNVFVLPEVALNGEQIEIDVAATDDDKQTLLAICETESVTQRTFEQLELLKNAENTSVVVIYSQYGSHNDLPETFREEFESKKFQLVAVVPPPFDDVYEYDIWMFETTFRNVLEELT
jgi:hypothetical protein